MHEQIATRKKTGRPAIADHDYYSGLLLPTEVVQHLEAIEAETGATKAVILRRLAVDGYNARTGANLVAGKA